MDYEDARAGILAILASRGAATNSELIDAVGGDQALFQRIREELILNDLADDKKGAGLIFLGTARGPAGTAGQRSAQAGGGREIEPSPLPAGPGGGHRIFLSYGRADANALAERLEQDLVRRGHRVWRDRSALKTGVSWEAQIEDAILSHEVFLCLLTPHAVRRPDGVCLDEISMARYNDRKIVPAMVIQCRQPLGIYRLDWVDLQDWQTPAGYERAFGQLLEAVERDAEVEGTCARIFSLLKPLDFGIEVSRLTRNFTGREWLFGRLDRWLADPRSRVFLITGDPGTGKSAILATLVHRNPHVAAVHFCMSSLADSLDPLRFVRSVAAQFASQMSDYRQALNELDREEFTETDPGSAFRRLIAGPLQREPPTRSALILVDALDESLRGGERNIAALLRDRMDDLPPWIRIVASSRLQPEILDLFSDHGPEHIQATGEENLGDIDRYFGHRLKQPGLAALLTAHGVDPAAVAERIKARSEGNFLYVTEVLRGIESGRIDACDLDRFPVGLVGIYQSFFERLFPAGQGFEELRRLLGVAAAAREPLDSDHIARFLGGSAETVEILLQKVAPFFPCRGRLYHPYHKSILDWLNGEAGSNRTFRLNRAQGHQRIAAALMADYRAGRLDRMVLSHLPAHLTETCAWDEVTEILTDLRFVASKCAGGMTFDLVRDYERLFGALPEFEDERRWKRERDAAIGRFVRDLVAFERGELPRLDPPVSPTPWSNERIELSEAQARTSPGRAHTLKAFARFVGTDAHHLARFGDLPGFCLQQATNLAAAGPVAEAAARWAEAGNLGPMLVKGAAYRPDYRSYAALIRVCEGHGKGVTGVAMSALGAKAVSGGGDGEVRVWDLLTGECERALKDHLAPVTSIALTPDGAKAVTGSEDKTVRVWDLRSMRRAAVLEGHTAPVRGVAITPSGRRAVSVGADRKLLVWDLDSAVCLQKLPGGQGKISSVAMSADGRLAVTGGIDSTIRVWDLGSGTCLRVLKGHEGPTLCVDLTPDGRLAISGSEDHTLRLWDVGTGRLIRTMTGRSAVPSASISADGRLAVSGSRSDDRTIGLWDLESGTCLRALAGHADAACAVRMTPDATLLVSGSALRDGTIGLWNLQNGLSTTVPEKHAGGAWSMAVDAECRVAVSGAGRRDKALKVWDPSTGKTVRALEGHRGAIWSAGLTPDSQLAISGSEDGTARIWDLKNGSCRTVLTGHDSHIWSVAVSSDGLTIATAGQDRTVRLWDLASGRELRVFRGHTDAVWCVAFTLDLQALVSGSRHRRIRVWDIRSGECVRTLEGHTGGVWNVAVSPDGRQLASASLDASVRVWDLATGRCCQSSMLHKGWVLNVAWSPDGRRMFSGGHDKTLVAWDVASGRRIGVLPERAGVTVISRMRKAGRLFYGTSDGTVAGVGWVGDPAGVPCVTAVAPGPRAAALGLESTRDGIPEAVCDWCGCRLLVPDRVTEAIDRATVHSGLLSAQPPCLTLSDDAWSEPGLESTCPQCERPLRFNPFIAGTPPVRPDS